MPCTQTEHTCVTSQDRRAAVNIQHLLLGVPSQVAIGDVTLDPVLLHDLRVEDLRPHLLDGFFGEKLERL